MFVIHTEPMVRKCCKTEFHIDRAAQRLVLRPSASQATVDLSSESKERILSSFTAFVYQTSLEKFRGVCRVDSSQSLPSMLFFPS
jgi:hypothetical protein